jgi:uncharacterized protein
MPTLAACHRALIVVALLSLLPSLALAGEIAVRASAVAYGAPDMATLEVGFTTTDEDVSAGLARADAAIAAVRAALEARGVEERDVRTTTFAIWREERYGVREGPEPVAVAYRVTHHLQVTVRDVGAVGAIIVAATEAGANHVGGIHFRVQDPREWEAAARRDAFAAARDKATQLAALAGLTLGDPTQIVEHGGLSAPVVQERAMFDAASPVAPGMLAFEIVLEVSFGTLP